MIGRIVKGVLRAAVAQPWDYQGEGAPDDWEMRVDQNATGNVHAVFNPYYREWTFYQGAELLFVSQDLADVDRHTRDWCPFLRMEDPDE